MLGPFLLECKLSYPPGEGGKHVFQLLTWPSLEEQGIPLYLPAAIALQLSVHKGCPQTLNASCCKRWSPSWAGLADLTNQLAPPTRERGSGAPSTVPRL